MQPMPLVPGLARLRDPVGCGASSPGTAIGLNRGESCKAAGLRTTLLAGRTHRAWLTVERFAAASRDNSLAVARSHVACLIATLTDVGFTGAGAESARATGCYGCEDRRDICRFAP